MGTWHKTHGFNHSPQQQQLPTLTGWRQPSPISTVRLLPNRDPPSPFPIPSLSSGLPLPILLRKIHLILRQPHLPVLARQHHHLFHATHILPPPVPIQLHPHYPRFPTTTRDRIGPRHGVPHHVFRDPRSLHQAPPTRTHSPSFTRPLPSPHPTPSPAQTPPPAPPAALSA